ncbi:acetyltransferase (GNAT) family protein [Dyadobacter jejuensis]|uniref:Acetyltransferase (GNAT) family protein n=1 Tax=Dyadobacter jejuensis TaxID=1082580 RepID=A0A316AQP4_9BACT|nr:GNAT family N-acetyltransferase [Dyadobacter jejuensis]PWJ59524.1 acetyltransferase (GNAT) family protein [Dyadobacter jejuensis]
MITIKRTHSEDPDFPFLTNLLDQALCDLYNTRQEDYADYNRITDLPTVVLAYDGTEPIGCGCFKIHDSENIEIKRMYVLPQYRGRGLARTLLKELEQWALSLGYKRSILETGKKQTEAIALYTHLGYEPIAGYNAYDALEISTCFAKSLI